ncbi:phosphotransferase [Ponticaulis profundi]|uniref:Phosphotransferase n=1 Tax=Ponticaulis profundi TaxID=2665222 RepID=A0ABW1SEE3_9PROT
MTPDIREWKKIDAPWLTAVLNSSGYDVDVSDFTAKKVGTGQIGDCVRFALNYSKAAPGAPDTIVGKFPSEGEESRATGISLGNYHREVKFYQKLKANARISTPECYFTDVNEDTHDFVLMMGDLAPAEQGDQLRGSTLEETKLVLTEAAKMHAAFWNDASLDQHRWVNGTTNADDPIQPEFIAELWTGFKQRYGNRVSSEARQIGDSMTRDIKRDAVFKDGARCLIHCDFRPDNMMFGTSEGGKPLTVVDWQSFAYGAPASDVGYFIAGALEPALRQKHEAELIDHYLQEIAAQGAGPYPMEEMKRHYVAGAFQHFLTAFFAAMLVTQTERGDDMFFKMLNGAVDLITDHNALDWYE